MSGRAAAMACAMLCVLPVAAAAQQAPIPGADVASIPAGTPIEFSFKTALSSRTSKIDDWFDILLAQPVAVDGRIVLPAGTPGKGQVVHAAKAGGGGKAGELIVTVRYLERGATRIPLRRFRPGSIDIGADRRGEALGANIVLPFGGFLVRGGERTIAAGTIGNALIAEDVSISLEKVPDAGPAKGEALP